MTALAHLLGVDAVQWRALVHVSLLTDVRQLQGSGLRLARSAAGSFGGAVLSQFLYGAFAAFVIGGLDDVFSASTVYFLLLLSTLGLALLVDFTGIVLSPGDYLQLAPRPIHARTFFVARLTSVSIFSVLLTAPLALPAAVGYLLKAEPSLTAALASLLAAGLAAVLVPLLVILLFLALIQVIPPDRLHRALGYVQFGLSFAFIGAFFLLSQRARGLDVLWLDKTPRAYLNPATWFAAWIEIAEGRAITLDWIAAAMPVGLLAVTAALVRGRLSLAYAERLATLTVARAGGTGHRPVPVPVLVFGPAHHAVGLLASAQFRTDQKFRLGVLGILPLTIIYLLAGVSEPEGPRLLAREPVLVYYAVLFFPVMLRQFLVYSESWRASWVFLAAPLPLDEVVVALKNTVVARFLVPYLLLVMLLLGWYYPRPFLEWLMHGVIIGLISHALLTADLWLNPSLPFSQPTRRGARSFALLALMVPTMAVIATIPLWRPYAYATASRTFVIVGVLVVVNVILHESLLVRVTRLSRHWAAAS